MRVLVLAGLLTAAMAPFAAAAENEIDCQVTDVARAQADQRLDQPPAAPAATPRPIVVQREAADIPRPAIVERRRNGKPIPDAQLIQPRGAL
ncbi:hypothetical protein [Candidatus Viadribacter manganicus]|uniref:Uncharacterized protein n=1 Tax=Candidatus Viadribacter manganicus TaxID=1759059 RepID=A0A1B1ALS1_9PROT|nr:hypothetical protein [Candidatus Viadribacter manganicus]ANP47522.1 hypothetical protein ATE48_17230 [Candidatus Viadribacter manganicus]